jgi:RES domain-containing protein
LDRVLTSYRIGDPNGLYPIFDATGSTKAPGRWNSATSPMIYSSLNYSTAMLEKLVHANGIMPPRQHFITITIPNGIAYETVTKDTLPGWHTGDCRIAKAFGDQWITERRSAILIVPSVVARMEQNLLINPLHPDATGITHHLPEPVWWDTRLFQP